MITDLVCVLPPPANPLEVPSSDLWKPLEKSFSKLPDDYTQFIQTYGTGYICDGYLAVFSPFAQNQYLNLIHQTKIITEAFAELGKQFPKDYAFEFFPKPGGLLPLGMNNEGAYMFWQTEGPAEEWTISVIACDSPTWQHFDTGLVDWLEGILTGRIRCAFFASDLLDFPVNFRSG